MRVNEHIDNGHGLRGGQYALKNKDILDFNLDDEQMDSISALNCNQRFNDPAKFCENSFGKFYSIYD